MARWINYKGRKCWKCNNEHTRIRPTGGPVWFRRYIKGVSTDEYECYYCYNKLENPKNVDKIKESTNEHSACEHYKRYTIVDGKPRWIVVNKNGNATNKNPTKEELENLQKEYYKINTDSRKYTKDQLLNYLKISYEENGKFPSCSDFENGFEYPNVGTYIDHFGSWNNALKLVGMDLDTRVRQGNLEFESQKGRWGELLVIEHFENVPIDLSGENCKSPHDGICPNGMNYEVKSSKLDVYRHRWKYAIMNKYKEEIEIYYFLAFNEDYTKLLHIWRVPGHIIENNYFTVKIGYTYVGNNIENMKKFEITEKFKDYITLNK